MPAPTHTAADRTPSPAALALRSRLVADDSATTALSAQQRLEAICASLATQLQRHNVTPYLLATLAKSNHGIRGPRSAAVGHLYGWPAGACFLSAQRPHLSTAPTGAVPATATSEGLSVTRYATTLLHPWQGPTPDGLGQDPAPALLLEEAPAMVRVRGILHTLPRGDAERDAVGPGTWYVRDQDATITLHDAGNGLVLRDLEHDLIRDVVALTAWWNQAS